MTVRPSKPLSGVKQSYWRVMGMADATGADLVEAYEAGELSDEVWAETVTRCRGCLWAAGCSEWLDAGDGGKRPVPQACPNSSLFEGLKQN